MNHNLPSRILPFDVPALRSVVRWLAPWLLFWIFFAWGWRIHNVFTHVPAYGDVLEVLWGILWYQDSIVIRHASPLFYPLVFHPVGWHTATLAHTPLLFLASLPLTLAGSASFAYNLLAILGLVIAFAGAFRFARLFASLPAAIIAASAFTMWGMCWSRVDGHLHIMWASALLPWLGWALEQAQRSEPVGWRWTMRIGLIWGVMINLALYGALIGAVAFVLWGCQVFHFRRMKQGVSACLVALVVALPTIVLYLWGSRQDHIHAHGVEHNAWWGASLNSLFVPSVFHPLMPLRSIAHSLYTGPYNESGVMNFGIVASFLALVGVVLVLKNMPRHTNLIGLVLVGIVLSLGLWLRWNGEPVQHPFFRPLNVALWELGHFLKPELFAMPHPPPAFDSGFPLPGLMLTAVIPFWELGRTVSRYAVVGMLGIVGLAALALERLPKVARYLITVVWLVEILPRPVGNLPVPFQPHPAYMWLAGQELNPGEGIADVAYPTLLIGGETVWATWLHQKPTASGVGSFWPAHTFALWEYLLQKGGDWSHPEIGLVFEQYSVRYLFLHIRGERERGMWDTVHRNPALRPLRCFEPLKGPTPWPYPICVAEVLPAEGPMNVMLLQGWSGREDWGVWAEGKASEAGWISPAQQDHRLRVGAFPLCVPGKHQQMIIIVNGQDIATYQWEECEHWEGDVPIPASLVKIGWNEISLEYAYALTPAEVTQGQNPDPRLLSVGFTKLEVIR